MTTLVPGPRQSLLVVLVAFYAHEYSAGADPGSKGHSYVLRISQKCLTDIQKSPIFLVYPWDVNWTTMPMEYAMDIQRIFQRKGYPLNIPRICQEYRGLLEIR